MTFTFEIPDEELCDIWDDNFKEKIVREALNSIAKNELDQSINGYYKNKIEQFIADFLKKREKEIEEKAVELISATVTRKKAIVEITPKVSEIAKSDKDFEQYIESIVTKTLSKKLKGLC